MRDSSLIVYYVLLLLPALFLCWFTDNTLAAELKVLGDRVILRASPDDTSEIVSQMSNGDILVTEKGVDQEWVEVIPPERVNFWVYGELVKEGVIIASKVQVRVGPGINYRVAGEIGKGARVSVKGEYREWLKIAPTPECRLWVNRKYVDPIDKPVPVKNENEVKDADNAAEATTAKIDKPGTLAKPASKRSVSPHVSDVQLRPVESRKSPLVSKGVPGSARRDASFSPEAVIRDKLASSKEQGRAIQYNGILRHAGLFVWRQPSKYRLVSHDDNGIAVTLCHVLGDDKQLAAMQDKDVSIHGREYWVQGVRQPVVIPDKILQKN